jgi:hypothetical protein
MANSTDTARFFYHNDRYWAYSCTWTDTTLWLEVGGRWERVPLLEICLP